MTAGTTAILILIILAGVHIYWAAGGKAGRGAAVPSRNGRPVLKPTPLTTLLVAVVLFVIAALLAVRIGWFTLPAFPYQHDLAQVAVWLTAAMFALRAIGDFRYVGFFKRVRDSRFARLDTYAYSPLCACLALLVAVSAVT
jgi:hypothetical protein